MSIIASLNELAKWVRDVATENWTWSRNSRCKYVILKIDTRSGAYEILDRDGKQITFDELEYQYSSKEKTS